MRRDQRSEQAKAWRKLYKTQAWLKGRLSHLAQHPLCEPCKARGRLTAATVVNHRIPHKGDVTLFNDRANWQSTCAPCHDGAIQSEERIGYSNEVGADGWPMDERHPSNRA